MSHSPTLSLVIPAYNEEELLPRLLDSVEVASSRFRHGRETVEVIVADNGSTDRTAAIARERGYRVVPVTKRVIAASRNGGAAAARGEFLAFVDADMRIHPGTFNAIEDALSGGRTGAGASGVLPDRWSLGLVATFLAFMPGVLLTNMDTGVVFCRRKDFEAIGGYNEARHYGEDVQFLWDLRRLGRSRRQSLERLRKVKAIASTRKFDTYGEWHYFRAVPRLAWLLLTKPAANSDFVQRYWYGDR